jgi:hypothetical protein
MKGNMHFMDFLTGIPTTLDCAEELGSKTLADNLRK